MAIRSVQSAKDSLGLLSTEPVGRQAAPPITPPGPYCRACKAPVHRVGSAWFHDSETPQLATIARDVVAP